MSDPHKQGRCEGHRRGEKLRAGVHDPATLVRVEGGKRISLRELCRSVCTAADGFLMLRRVRRASTGRKGAV